MCRVHGKDVKLEEVTVAPRGAPAFQLGLAGVPVTATLPARCGAPLDLEVGGAIELTARRDDVWMYLSRDVTADGMVIAKAGSSVIDACVRNGRVFGTAVIYADDVIPGEKKRPSIAVRDVEIPCDALSLEPVATEADASFSAAAFPGDAAVDDDAIVHNWQLRSGRPRLALRRAPTSKQKVYWIDSASCDGCLYVSELERKGRWVHVETYGEGVTVRGWALASDLERLPDDLGIGRAYMCSGDHGGAAGGFGFAGSSVVRGATVKQGATIYAAPSRGPWGHFSAATHVKVRIEPGLWATLEEAPGLTTAYPSGSISLDEITLDP